MIGAGCFSYILRHYFKL